MTFFTADRRFDGSESAAYLDLVHRIASSVGEVEGIVGSPKNGDLRRRCCKRDEPVPYTDAYETDLRNPIKSLRKLERTLTVHVDTLDAWALSHILPGEISRLYQEHFAEFIDTVLRKARTPQEERKAIKILDSMADVVVRYSHGRN